MQLSANIQDVLATIVAAGGRPLLIGGVVRDFVMGLPNKDTDIEVFNLAPNALLAALGKHGKVKLVGESFGVFKLTLADGSDLDISSPRKDNKSGKGHRSFDIDVDPFMSIEEAVVRRDFTMNAMAMDPFTGEIIDPLNGQQDIRNGVLRATGPQFAEDPLRVLRGMQFAARFGMSVDSDTAMMCHLLMSEFSTIAPERIWGEWEKFFLKGKHPRHGLQFLVDTGWIEFFPEIAALVNTPQEPEWHPEGGVFTHTALVMQEMVRIADRDNLSGDERVIAMMAALAHDFGKPSTTEFIRGAIRSPGHDLAGMTVAVDFMERIGAPVKFCGPVTALVGDHMSHIGVEPNARIVRRLAHRLDPHTTIPMWERIVEADASGRAPLPAGRPALAWLEMAKEVNVEHGKPKPIIGGAMLIARGFRPGPAFRPILDAAFSAQMDGDVTLENAEEWLDTFLVSC